MNKYSIFKTKPKLSYFSGNQQSIILLIETKSLIKNLLILNCQLVQYPKIQETILPELQKVSSYTWVFTVYGKSVSNRPVYIGITGVYKILTFYFSLRNPRSLQLSYTRVTAFSPASLILERFWGEFRKPVSKTYQPENELLNLLMTSTHYNFNDVHTSTLYFECAHSRSVAPILAAGKSALKCI